MLLDKCDKSIVLFLCLIFQSFPFENPHFGDVANRVYKVFIYSHKQTGSHLIILGPWGWELIIFFIFSK